MWNYSQNMFKRHEPYRKIAVNVMMSSAVLAAMLRDGQGG